MRLARPLSILLLSTALAFPLAAQPVPANEPASDPIGIRGDFSGTWFNPQQSGHGLFVEVLDRGRAAVAWFTFDPAGQPLWLYGVLAVDGASLVGDLAKVTGGRFGPAFDPALIQQQAWGGIELDVEGCDTAELRWQSTDPAFGSGSLPMVRLTALQGQRCNVEEEFGEQRTFAFERGTQGFDVLFADLPTTGLDIYELDFAWEALPAPLAARRGLRLSGHNRSDDLAMLIKAPLGGLLPNVLYKLELEVELASSVPTGCAGIGGSPGDSVYIKLGATTDEPLAPAVDEGGTMMRRLNFDYGQQAQDGAQAKVVGTFANSYSCDDGIDAPWELRTLDSRGHALRARADANGRLWVVAGTDSAFEGKTDIYFTALRVRLEPVGEG
jgi:hypothetical protein